MLIEIWQVDRERKVLEVRKGEMVLVVRERR